MGSHLKQYSQINANEKVPGVMRFVFHLETSYMHIGFQWFPLIST